MCVCSAMGRVSEPNQPVFFVGIFIHLFKVGSDQILKSVLDQDLLFFWICRIIRSHFKVARVLLEVYFEDDGNLGIVAIIECKT